MAFFTTELALEVIIVIDILYTTKEVWYAKGQNDRTGSRSRRWFPLGRLYLALELGGITGRVWNNDDGTVEILAQAESSAIMAKFIQEIRKGPTPFSKVTYLDVQLSNFPSYSDFKVAN